MTDFRIRAYAGGKHRSPLGSLILETTHTSMGSAQVEVAALASRAERGEIWAIDVIDQRPGGDLTQIGVQPSRVRWKK